MIPAYKEDYVIINSVKKHLSHNYPCDKFEVFIIADSLQTQTIEELKQLPVNIIEVNFTNSTKAKALQTAAHKIYNKPAEIIVILDADNIMAPGFLHAVNNAYESGAVIMQAHRTAKNFNNSLALLDACSEEINNNIFRRGHTAVGLPSGITGSGIAFDSTVFFELIKDIEDTVGEDRAFEFKLLHLRYSVAFLNTALVYDEKTSVQKIFINQRTRWLSIQLTFCRKYFKAACKQLLKGNIAFFDKFCQTLLLPRVVLLAILFIWNLLSLFLYKNNADLSFILLVILILSLLSGIPARWFNRYLLLGLLHIPVTFIYMLIASVRVKKSSGFIHTIHNQTDVGSFIRNDANT